MSLTLLISGKDIAPYIGDQWEKMSLTLVIKWEECPLHWWSVGRMSLTFGDQWEECFLTLVIQWKNAPYIGGSVGRMPLTLVIS
ncbi:unnamed protein product, partial [Staurois parvus]